MDRRWKYVALCLQNKTKQNTNWSCLVQMRSLLLKELSGGLWIFKETSALLKILKQIW